MFQNASKTTLPCYGVLQNMWQMVKRMAFFIRFSLPLSSVRTSVQSAPQAQRCALISAPPRRTWTQVTNATLQQSMFAQSMINPTGTGAISTSHSTIQHISNKHRWRLSLRKNLDIHKPQRNPDWDLAERGREGFWLNPLVMKRAQGFFFVCFLNQHMAKHRCYATLCASFKFPNGAFPSRDIFVLL